jgi:hypothetical protein
MHALNDFLKLDNEGNADSIFACYTMAAQVSFFFFQLSVEAKALHFLFV